MADSMQAGIAASSCAHPRTFPAIVVGGLIVGPRLCAIDTSSSLTSRFRFEHSRSEYIFSTGHESGHLHILGLARVLPRFPFTPNFVFFVFTQTVEKATLLHNQGKRG
jgi:hypothetical protein